MYVIFCILQWTNVAFLIRNDAAAVENSTEIPQKIKNISNIWSSCPNSGYLSKEYKNINLKRYLHSHVPCSAMYNSEDTVNT